jgi:spore germination protein
MNKKNKQVTAYQATAIVANAIVGVVLLTLPRDVARAAGTGGPLAVIGAGSLSLLVLYLYTALGRRFSRSTLPEYAVKTLGVFFGALVALTFVAGWLLVVALTSRLFAEIVVTSVLPRIPLETGVIVMLLLAAHLATQDIKTFARVNELFLPIIVGTFAILLALSASRVNIWRMLPPFGYGLRQVGAGVFAATPGYAGFELIALFMPFYAQPEAAIPAHRNAMLLVIALFTLTVLAATGAFGVTELVKSQWPTLELVRLVGFLGAFERLEAPFLAVYVITVFTTIGANFFGAVLTLGSLFNIKSREGWPYLLVIPLYYLAIQPPNIIALNRLISLVGMVWWSVILVAPLLILLMAVLRGKEDRPDDADQAKS